MTTEGPAMNPADVAVIIACKARVGHLRQSLPRWQACDPAPGQMIVVDYGCPDGAANYVAQHFPGMSVVQVLRDTDLYRAGRARNIGAKHASWPWLLFADASTVPGPDILARICAAAAGHDLVLVSHGFDEVTQKPLINGTCLVRNRLWASVRGYDETPLWFYNDIDFYQRCQAAGAEVAYLYNTSWLAASDEERFRFRLLQDRNRDIEAATDYFSARNRRVNTEGFGLL